MPMPLEPGYLAAFLAGRIGFLEIAAIVADTLGRYDPPAPVTLDAVLAIDAEARRLAEQRVADRRVEGLVH